MKSDAVLVGVWEIRREHAAGKLEPKSKSASQSL